ncbi:MAG TPA: CPBP family intramembrane metalloprotease [Opitutae bacterium]|nr:CPBP family intramembrane metalloprotease [Opitutae bacterium]
MSQEDPILILIIFAASLYLGKICLSDLRAQQNGTPNPRAFPGATPCPPIAIYIAIAGALLILSIETGGEYLLSINEEQSSISALFFLAMLAAAFMEELIFRGYLVITSKGPSALISSIIGFSALFALLHPFLWNWDAGLTLNIQMKGVFSTLIVFINSLWFYTVRFYPLNQERSLIPCIVAHLSSNCGVFLIKWAQGYVTTLY